MKIRIIGIITAVVLAIGGAVVLTGYVSGADARALANTRMVGAYVVTRTVPKGTTAARLAPYIAARSVPAVGAVPGRVTSLAQLAGLVTSTRLEVGEQVLRSRWISPAKQVVGAVPGLKAGLQALTLSLPPEREYGGRLAAGDKVGVIVTSDDKAKRNRQILHQVAVLSVQSAAAAAKASGATGAPANSNVLVTLALNRRDAEDVVWGQQFGSVYLTNEAAGGVQGGQTVSQGQVLP